MEPRYDVTYVKDVAYVTDVTYVIYVGKGEPQANHS